ncbi:DeoR/GlpR family DNA-binding transcription regulator [Blastochloris viridis]|uniref:Glycerol-3-phosphate regulon repressor n=1 Tax=Blastochloris viridis TaxID=1079 RepID=A0A182D2K8_BLAVI|nr:DeoR/GlpR family DNA-binding transcription regulator [Blastochloris viridis]BAR99746.1 glycerol-3-phosphate regulon repressor [Blastochloris viridis]
MTIPIDPPDDSPDAAGVAITERQQAIVDRVRHDGFVTIEALARDFGVSAQTIRREIIRLNELELLQRFHGGAGLPVNTVRLGYAEKRQLSATAKARIGRRAADLIASGTAVFIDVGTTAEAVGRALTERADVRIFTPSLRVATLFAGRDDVEVFVPGGILRGADGSLIGDATGEMLARFRFDVAFIGLSGFDADGTPMDFDMQKVAVKRVAISRARQVYGLADSSKFGREAIVRIAPPGSFSGLVCDRAPDGTLGDTLQRIGVEILTA